MAIVDAEGLRRWHIHHNVDGLLVALRSTKPEGGLDQLMSDSALRRRLAARAFEARNRFSLERIANLRGGLLEEVLSAAVRTTWSLHGAFGARTLMQVHVRSPSETGCRTPAAMMCSVLKILTRKLCPLTR